MTTKLDGVEGKVAIVTGGASGIGEASALRLAELGAHVCIVDLNGDAVATLVDKIGSERAHGVEADVSTEAGVKSYVQSALDRFGRIDFLHSNAGIVGTPGPLAEATGKNFDEVFAVNVRSAVLGLAAVAGPMQAQGGGSIVITASVSGVRPSPGLGVYAASKIALVALAKTAAVEFGQSGIRVNAIAPGLTDTPAFRATNQVSMDDDSSIFDKVMLPLARVGTPAEVANLVSWLMSDQSSYVTGGLYHVDGGLGI